jgi:hypothetical protein
LGFIFIPVNLAAEDVISTIINTLFIGVLFVLINTGFLNEDKI